MRSLLSYFVNKNAKTVKSLGIFKDTETLEYRVFDHHCLKKICEILDTFGIKKVFPSTGYFIDNLADLEYFLKG
jgi:hypothetical protein